ncbi:MAG: hypothetical protein HW414_581 [Dehalococcoidia bacterium]|nr:hypothetical protein [Dehalococcoidia bacterium]
MVNGRIPSRVRNTALLGKSVVNFWSHYFGNRRFPKDQEFYVVYTSLDHSIPFQPDSTLGYWLINLRLMPASARLAGPACRGSFDAIMRAYVDIAKEGAAAFREVPTIMPHLTEHVGHSLHAAQTLLRPINCCPSLHTATPFFAYNLGAHYFPEKEPELRRHVGDIVSLVIRAKLHAMIDIAFGLFLAKRVCQGKLGLGFCDLESFFTQEQKSKDKIPYEHIYRMYHEINELETAMGGEEVSFAGVMERYFQEIGLPRVKREQSNCLYDLEQKALVCAPELRVGKGLF